MSSIFETQETNIFKNKPNESEENQDENQIIGSKLLIDRILRLSSKRLISQEEIYKNMSISSNNEITKQSIYSPSFSHGKLSKFNSHKKLSYIRLASSKNLEYKTDVLLRKISSYRCQSNESNFSLKKNKKLLQYFGSSPSCKRFGTQEYIIIEEDYWGSTEFYKNRMSI